MRLRNERARGLDFRSFADLRLRFAGLTPERLKRLATAVVGPARRQIRDLRGHFLEDQNRSEWYPWDMPFSRAVRVPLPDRCFPQREMLPRILDAVAQWGFPVHRMRFRVTFHDVPSGGMTIAPDPPRDVRILVHPSGGWNSYMIMFHEVGHAVHSASIRAPRHLLRWSENIPGFGAFHEGIGGLFEDIPSLAEWLSTQPGISQHQAETFAESAKKTSAVDAAWHAAWLQVEQALYEDPDRDPTVKAHEFERSVFGYGGYAPRSFVDHFFVDSPVYAPNYLLSILFGYQIRRTLRELYGDPFWPNPKIGPWLIRHWMRPGSTFDWIPRMKEVTGRPFGPEAFREALR